MDESDPASEERALGIRSGCSSATYREEQVKREGTGPLSGFTGHKALSPGPYPLLALSDLGLLDALNTPAPLIYPSAASSHPGPLNTVQFLFTLLPYHCSLRVSTPLVLCIGEVDTTLRHSACGLPLFSSLPDRPPQTHTPPHTSTPSKKE